MTLAIRSLSTRCHVPRSLAPAARMVDGAARGAFATELASLLGPSLDRTPGVVRIRRLPVRVALRASELTPARLAEAWATAFLRALFQALACPEGEGPFQVVRYESRARQLAAFVAAIFGGATSRWQFATFESSALSAAPGTVFDLCPTTGELLELLAALEAERALEPLLLRLDDLALERLFARLATTRDARVFADEDLLDAIALLRAWQRTATLPTALRMFTRPGDSLATIVRRLALRLFVFAATRREITLTAFTPRASFHALLALAAIAEARTLRGAVELLSRQPAPDAVRDVLARWMHEPPRAAILESIAEIAGDATITAATLARTQAEARWVESPVASIFLLAPIVQRLGWWREEREIVLLLVAAAERVLRTVVAQAAHGRGLRRGSPRAATGVAALQIDPAVVLFGGCFGDLDVASLRAFAASREDDVERRAQTLVTEFRLRVRGFRDAPLPAIVRQFLARPGRILVEERRLTVVLDPSPYHVALHLSGADDEIADAPWLGGRAVHFLLKGI